LIFIDEAGYSLTPNTRRQWAPRGVVPKLRHSYRSWRKLSAQSAVTVSGSGSAMDVGLVWRLHPGKTVRSQEILAFLRQCRARVAGPAIVIWDNAATHKTKRIQAWFDEVGWKRIQMPAYCPELNCDENVWNWTKNHDLADVTPRDHAELLANVRESLRRLGRRWHVLRWCLWNTDLPWSLKD
jgi:transposase